MAFTDSFRYSSEYFIQGWMFMCITYVMVWLFWLPMLLDGNCVKSLGNGLIYTILILSAVLPSLVAFILMMILPSPDSFVKVLKMGFSNFRFHFSILLIQALSFIAVITRNLVFNDLNMVEVGQSIFHWQEYLIIGIFFIVASPFGEEFGWRVYLQDRFQQRWGLFSTSALIGVFWGLWYLPILYGISGQNSGSLFYLALVVAIFVSLNVTLLSGENKIDLSLSLILNASVKSVLLMIPIFLQIKMAVLDWCLLIIVFTSPYVGLIYNRILCKKMDLPINPSKNEDRSQEDK